ncbi:MAG: hypothetical protein Kow0042_31750 [Calditrichia bacterium]
MSKNKKRVDGELSDWAAIKLQQLQQEGKIKRDRPLLRIDNRREAAEAPFQFDTVKRKLHRKGCRAIPRESRSALYGIWEVTEDELKFACDKCKPAADQGNGVNQKKNSDLLFGFISIIDQFGSVLVERGREYRNSELGRQVESNLKQFISDLDQKQQDVMQMVLSSLDGILHLINDLNTDLQRNNNGFHGNGQHPAPGEEENEQEDVSSSKQTHSDDQTKSRNHK